MPNFKFFKSNDNVVLVAEKLIFMMERNIRPTWRSMVFSLTIHVPLLQRVSCYTDRKTVRSEQTGLYCNDDVSHHTNYSASNSASVLKQQKMLAVQYKKRLAQSKITAPIISI